MTVFVPARTHTRLRGLLNSFNIWPAQFSALETMGLLNLEELDASLGNLYDATALGDPSTADFSDDDSDGDEARAAAREAAAAAASQRDAAATSTAAAMRPPPVITKLRGAGKKSPAKTPDSGSPMQAGASSARRLSPVEVMNQLHSAGSGGGSGGGVSTTTGAQSDGATSAGAPGADMIPDTPPPDMVSASSCSLLASRSSDHNACCSLRPS
jgi:hypothetical protein